MNCPTCRSAQRSSESCIICGAKMPLDRLGENTEALELHGDSAALEDHDVQRDREFTPEEYEIMARNLMADMDSEDDLDLGLETGLEGL